MTDDTKPPVDPDYVVGYGKPPVATRFGAGNAGRPKGSRKKAAEPRTMAQALENAMTRPRKVRRGDVIVDMTALEIMVESLVTMATTGSIAQKAAAIRLIEKHLAHLLVPPAQEMSVTYFRAPGSQVVLPPAELWSRRR